MDPVDREGRMRGRCPICGATPDPAHSPFCSRRCADIDLSRWLRGAYAIPARSADDEEDGSAAGSATPAGQGAGQPDGDEL
ncbi:MAG: DNA gyrase inhibitor YacG [Hyphomicrobiaceae bacterium]|nr:DNA gyrase inhibitor YacG [Hyphomicrobiaceae bacterium]